MAAGPISRTTLLAVIVAITAALVGRSWLQVVFLDDGMHSQTAADLSYLLVPVVIALFLFPLWPGQKQFLASQFRRGDLCLRVMLRALAIGVLIRVMSWCELVAGVSFGLYSSTDANAVVGPSFSFRCASVELVLLGFLVMAVLVPMIEEIVHRGYVMSALRHRGYIVSLLISAVFFAVFHPMSSWLFAFLAGLIFGTQYWITRSLWPSLISHATVNGLIQIDWRCLSGQWNPPAKDVPLILPGFLAVGVLVVCVAALLAMIQKMATEVKHPPR
jgi:membrane protease YdiL (CAAX protease family)